MNVALWVLYNSTISGDGSGSAHRLIETCSAKISAKTYFAFISAVALDAQIQEVTVFSQTELSVTQSAHLDRKI